MIHLEFDGKRQRFSKAPRTGEVVSKYVADGKRARRRTEADRNQQMTMLPDNTPVPFTKEG